MIDSALFLLAATLGAYLAGQQVYRITRQHALAQPILVGILLVTSLLISADIPFAHYNQQVSILNLLLGTATVALAVPIHKNFSLIRENFRPILIGVIISGAITSGLAVLIAWGLGASETVLLSIAPKSITTPFAIGVSESIGGYPSLSAAMVILTGILVAVTGAPLAKYIDHSPMTLGLSLGMTGHGIATARAFELDARVGAFSALGMGLMGVYVSTVLPYVLLWLRS